MGIIGYFHEFGFQLRPKNHGKQTKKIGKIMTKDHGLEMLTEGTTEYKRGRVDVLVDLVVAVARTDTTEPDPKNPRAGWRTDQLLRDVDNLVISQDGDSAVYAEIARQAKTKIKVDEMPDIAALLGLAEFNGERRLPVTAASELRLSQMAQCLITMVAALPEGNRKTRCQSLLLYHVGVFSDAYGHFSDAVEMQRQAAEQAKYLGDGPGVAVCCFLGVVCCLKQALRDGIVATELERLFTVLQGSFAALVRATRGSAM